MLDHKPLALLGRALAAHLGPEPSATSQGEWQCPAAPISRDRRHSERSNPGQDPAQPSPVPQGAGGAKGAAGRRVAGEGQETHCLDFGLSESRQGRRVQGGGGYVRLRGWGHPSWASCAPRSPTRMPWEGQPARSPCHIPMRTLLSWFGATLSLALGSDVFLEQTLKKEEGGREEGGIRILGKEHFTYFIQVSCCSQLGPCCLPQFTLEWHPSWSTRQGQRLIPLLNCQPIKSPHISRALFHVSLPLGRREKERRHPWRPTS